MICAKCKVKVSVTDRKCPECGHDLLQFGGAAFYEEKGKDSNRYGQGIKDMVFGGLKSEWKEDFKTLEPDEKKIYSPLADRLNAFFRRHISEEALEDFFDRDVLPLVDDLSKSKDNAELFHKVESAIRIGLGDDAVYQHYRIKAADVLRILRAGELANELMDKEKGDYDLSVRMFPYFKAIEISCSLHTNDRYKQIEKNSQLKAIAQWTGIIDESGRIQKSATPGKLADEIYFEDALLGGKKKTWFSMVIDIMDSSSKKYNLSGACRAGLSIYAFGRNWDIRLKRKHDNDYTAFRVNNIFRAKEVSDEHHHTLQSDLCKLQDMRNKRVHENVENDKYLVGKAKSLSYDCLKDIPQLLSI